MRPGTDKGQQTGTGRPDDACAWPLGMTNGPTRLGTNGNLIRSRGWFAAIRA